MEKIKEIFNQYKTYILYVIIVILIIIIGFMYSNNVTAKADIKEVEKPKKEEKEEIRKVFVDIKGEVKVPGVYELNDTERVIDVIKKANGLTSRADTSYINLSKKVKDEMVIIIYSKNEIKEYEKSLEENKIKEIIKYEVIEKELPCPNTTNESCINTKIEDKKVDNSTKEDNNIEKETTKIDETNKLVNLNTATKDELLTLTGIGESKADLIIEYRNANKFNSIEDLKNVKGIGDSLFDKVKDSITV